MYGIWSMYRRWSHLVYLILLRGTQMLEHEVGLYHGADALYLRHGLWDKRRGHVGWNMSEMMT